MARRRKNDNTQRDAILSAAGALFLEKGYKETGLRNIAAKLDISPGLIGYYFSGKRAIAEDLLSGQLACFSEMASAYVPKDDPILRCAVLIKLQITVLSSPTFLKFYIDALREDIIFTVITRSGIDTYLALNEKYNLGYSEDYLRIYDLNAVSSERTLMLYGGDLLEGKSLADMVFLTHVGRLYGTEEFLQSKCRESELITARIICEHPGLLTNWSR